MFYCNYLALLKVKVNNICDKKYYIFPSLEHLHEHIISLIFSEYIIIKKEFTICISFGFSPFLELLLPLAVR